MVRNSEQQKERRKEPLMDSKKERWTVLQKAFPTGWQMAPRTAQRSERPKGLMRVLRSERQKVLRSERQKVPRLEKRTVRLMDRQMEQLMELPMEQHWDTRM